ncbi:alpha/beta fold hydrolase, partial [Dehalococcoides mccartyi]|nr:alpha/beta fold hydrolase [Dehalococcoides mccartyi]
LNLMVTAIGNGTITLQLLDDAEEEEEYLPISAKWGVTDGEDYGQLGDLLSDSGGLVTREFVPLKGDFAVGQQVYLDRSAYPHDPGSAFGLDYQEAVIPGPLGNLRAWYVAPEESQSGSSDVWAVLVHGRTATRDASIRLLDDLSELGIPSLTIEYRNDKGAPASESGYYDFGVTEWEDVEAATRYALENGASKIVLIGYSMGGGIIVSYQLQSDLADRTVGLILDAPMLNFGRTIDRGAEERSVPAPITAAAKFIATLRFGIDWGALDYLSRASELDVPILLFHGDADILVPIETSLEFAEKLPGLVELHTFADAEHVAGWNRYTDEYESFVREFINRVR